MLKQPYIHPVSPLLQYSPESVLNCLSQPCWQPEGPAHCLTEWKCWNQLHHYVCLCPREEAKSGFWQPEAAECVCAHTCMCMFGLCSGVLIAEHGGSRMFCGVICGNVLFSLSGPTLHNLIRVKRTDFPHSSVRLWEITGNVLLIFLFISRRCTSLQWRRSWFIVSLWLTEASRPRRRKGNTGMISPVFLSPSPSPSPTFCWLTETWSLAKRELGAQWNFSE